MGISHEDLCKLMIISRSVLCIVRNVSDSSCRENKNSHFMFNNFVQNSAVHEITWKNVLEPDSPQMTIWCMSLACQLARVADTY